MGVWGSNGWESNRPFPNYKWFIKDNINIFQGESRSHRHRERRGLLRRDQWPHPVEAHRGTFHINQQIFAGSWVMELWCYVWGEMLLNNLSLNKEYYLYLNKEYKIWTIKLTLLKFQSKACQEEGDKGEAEEVEGDEFCIRGSDTSQYDLSRSEDNIWWAEKCCVLVPWHSHQVDKEYQTSRRGISTAKFTKSFYKVTLNFIENCDHDVDMLQRGCQNPHDKGGVQKIPPQ